PNPPFDDPIPLVHEHHPRREQRKLALVVVSVAHDDHRIARRAHPCRRPIQLDDAAPAFTLDHVRLESRARIHIHHLHLLVGLQISRVHQVAVQSQAPLILQIRAGNRCAMDLRLAHPATHSVRALTCRCQIPRPDLSAPNAVSLLKDSRPGRPITTDPFRQKKSLSVLVRPVRLYGRVSKYSAPRQDLDGRLPCATSTCSKPSSNDNPTPAPLIGRPGDHHSLRDPAQPMSKNTVGRRARSPYPSSARPNQYASPASAPMIWPRTVCAPPRYHRRCGATVPTLVPALAPSDALSPDQMPRDTDASSDPRP